MSISRIFVFLFVVGLVLFGLHYYLWARLVRDTHLPAPWSTVATYAIGSMAALLLGGMLVMRALPRSVASPILWVAFTWLGLAFFFVVLFASVDAARGVVAVVRAFTTDGTVDPNRRVFLGRTLGATVGALGFVLGGVSVSNVVRAVAVKRVTVPIARLSETISGYRIVQLSDIHVGPTIGKDFIEQLVAQTNALEPDLVAITGDLVDGSVSELAEHVAPLAKLRAKDGVYFVTGNHEYYSGADEWIAYLTSLGVRVLRNERVAIGGRDGFDLAGVDDWTAHQFGAGHGADLPRALQGRDPRRPLVLLAHQPKAIVQAAKLGVDLQLSGHTHGGQLFPFNYLVKLQQPYVAGLHAHGDAKIYVSQGTGYWGPPMRLGAPAEITRIELAAASA
jgi:predicted MPP superfamily phosphohydrolase